MITITQVARRLGVSRPRVAYAISKANIRHAQRAGLTKLYDEDQMPAIEKALGIIRVRPVGDD